MLSQKLNNLGEKKFIDTSWDFRKEYTKSITHGYHTYPAMMIPQIARRLIRSYGKNANILLDPFMGSGTALLEGILHSQFKEVYGIDINPLALLISKVKITPIEPQQLWDEYHKLVKNYLSDKNEVSFKQKKIETPKFFNIDFWFKPEAIIDLTLIKNNIEKIKNKDIKNFFLIVFSETVRNVSNTRKREYKLYRLNPEALKKHNPKTIEEFRNKAKKNIYGMEEFIKEKYNCKVHILDEDTRYKTSLQDNSVDLIITSPPYGDSGTTVAYGQFSRLALQWLDYDKQTVSDIDKISLGGIPTKDLKNYLSSPTLKKTLNKISKIDPRRAKDVLSFYVDFDKCVEELHRVTKKGAFLCFVVGNRTVKGTQIPTDEIVLELFQAKNNYKHHNTFIRNIPHKRMPKLNSPTNITGNHAVTMNEEWIVILEKQ
ncbi:MAG: DNA methyltransferase [Candidatus Aenigmarchaeota archaeon]|nr:DNA methyltransferase [Candidatus Aenigmarchaeota archaeon]